ncbi:MAG: TetR/AcrR family transcriptional regulator [Clostridia bacterium]|nr:TetR/AcrR family transcriptional regulator [Clostridia bacterium]
MLKGDLRKQAIIDTAEKLFFEKGYVKTTIQDFLEALDCSKGSFYHHFDSKLQVLTELCRQKASAGYVKYQLQHYSQPLEQLNSLIYCAMPFRENEDKTLALLIPLTGMTDGKLVLDAMLDAQKEEFFPEMCRLLDLLKAKGDVYFTLPMLPEILWDAYSAVYRRLMKEAVSIRQGGTTGTAIQLIEAERFLWERLLDAPFGSIELIRADEALLTISHAISRIKRIEDKEK